MKKGGELLIQNHYEGSISKALKSIYPMTTWQSWKFHPIPLSHWMAEDLNILCEEDWYQIRQCDISKREVIYMQMIYS
jgi:hypothetical protein